MRAVEALLCDREGYLASNHFRTAHAPEKRVNGVIYRRTGLDDGPRYLADRDGPRYLAESNAGPRYLPQQQEQSIAVQNW